MGIRRFSVGKGVNSWKAGSAQTITFIVTDDCNLRCKYCYVTHKCSTKKMSFETAKQFIDTILTTDIHYSDAVIIEFIGGEPMLEAKLVSQIADYFKLRAFELDHPWYWNYRLSVCTNGVNYTSKDVQGFVAQNHGKLSLTISIDGTKEKHDMQRVFPDGSGSYDTISKGIDLWLQQFSGATKMTFASDDLPLLKESVISLWDKGITEVASNVVFEDLWKEGDDRMLETQLKELADYVIDNQLFNSGRICTFFDETIGHPYVEEDNYKSYCGAGKMLALGSDGRVFPCLRFYSHSLNNHPEWPIGDMVNGLDMERVRPFMVNSVRTISDDECLNCPIASGCGFCQGFNYDDADTPTNSHRAKYICKMHRARVRANEYYFAKLKNLYGIRREVEVPSKQKLYLLLADDYVSYCMFDNRDQSRKTMTPEQIKKGLEYAAEHFMRPVFVHSRSNPDLSLNPEYVGYDILHIVPGEFLDKAREAKLSDVLPVFNAQNINSVSGNISNCILNVHESELDSLAYLSIKLLDKANRVNVNILDLSRTFDEKAYEGALIDVREYLTKLLNENGVFKEYNLLTDICLLSKHANCQAGENSFTYGSDGKLHICPAFYSKHKDQALGTIEEGIVSKYDPRLYTIEKNTLCRECDAYHCRNCVYVNWTNTNEINVSPSFQCRKSFIERRVAQTILERLKMSPMTSSLVKTKTIAELPYLDPIKGFLDKVGSEMGTYKYKID